MAKGVLPEGRWRRCLPDAGRETGVTGCAKAVSRLPRCPRSPKRFLAARMTLNLANRSLASACARFRLLGGGKFFFAREAGKAPSAQAPSSRETPNSKLQPRKLSGQRGSNRLLPSFTAFLGGASRVQGFGFKVQSWGAGVGRESSVNWRAMGCSTRGRVELHARARALPGTGREGRNAEFNTRYGSRMRLSAEEPLRQFAAGSVWGSV